MKYLMLVFLVGVLFSTQTFGVELPQIFTSKQTYHYGDYLSVTIKVSEVTGSDAVMYIIDSSGTKSTAIPVKIRDTITTIAAQAPFDSLLFKEGKYELQLDYDGTKLFAEFELVDIGNIVMPLGSNAVVPQWTGGLISDYGLLKFLADKNTIILPEGKTLKESVKIPSWYKTNALWWSEKKITDEEFVNGLDYLLSRQVIVL
ncbi:MAG: hypothetical protein ACT4NT_05830 [Nitrososphaerota archaeon]